MGELAVMFSFVLLASIIVFGFASSMHKRHIAYKERRDALEREEASGGASATEIVELKERIQVLERLATDRGQILADEIEQLRLETSDKEKA